MKRQAYLDLIDKQREELNNFPIAYAFDDKQLKEALEKLGATSVDECVTIMGHGDIVKKENAKPFLDMCKRHNREIREALLADEEFAEAAFLYEMDNHEYAINWDGDGDVLGCFGLEEQDLYDLNLDRAYRMARKKHMDHAREWDMI